MRKPKICIIDADSLLYYTMGANSLAEGLDDLDKRIMDILTRCKAKDFIVCLTEDNCFRYDLATIRPYKGNRKKGTKPIIFYALREHLKQQYGAVSNDRLEADDLVAFYAGKISGEYMPIICSPDKDVLQQVSGTHYNYNKSEFVKTSRNEAFKFLLLQTLTGDTTDNIEGIPGVGQVKASKILGERVRIGVEGKVLTAYVEEFGISDGIYRFQENFRLVYLLRTDEDMLREIGLVPSMPVIQSINPDTSKDAKKYTEF
jgi:5'-3' exonuclease